jgi:drug/metabolite transporter (DMT)-like permease
MMSQGSLGILYTTIVAVSYAFMSIFAKLIYQYGYSPYGLILFQFLIVTVIMWGIAVPDIRKTEMRKIRKREWVDLSVVGAFWGMMTMSYFFALEMLPVSLAIVLYFLYPVLVPILKLVFERQKPAMYVIISLVMTFGGVLLGASLTGEELQNISVQGIVLGLASAVSFALFIYYYDRPVYTLPSYLSTAVVVSASTVFLALFFPFFPIEHPIDGRFLSFSLLVGVLAQLVPVLFLQFAIRRIGSVLASIIQTSELPLTITLAFLFFQEPIKPIQILGIILIVSGIVYSNLKGRVQHSG